MAVMWPKRLPAWVLNDPRRRAEREVYGRLQVVLDDSWSVYYSRPWWGLTATGAEVDGEADFIVAHPERGVLFLEVKGGLVEHDPATGGWTSKDRLGIRHRIKDPIGQAVKSKHELLKKFSQNHGWPHARVRMRHGAVFPDCEADGAKFIAGYESGLFCFASDLRDRFTGWLKARLSSHVEGDTEVGPGVGGVAAIDATIAAPTNLTVPLHRQLSSDLAEQDAMLTGAQLMTITSVDTFPRVVVEGGAGTGKTVVACELAVRTARKGVRTLLCCLSLALVAAIKQRIGEEANLDIMAVGELSRSLGSRYGAVIVDEGQDIDWHQWDHIERLVAANGLLRVFFDSNQAVYRARDDLETRLQAAGFPLRLNLRNTQRVASVTEKLYRGPLIACSGPEGKPVVTLELPVAKAPDAVVDAVDELVRGQRLLPADVAVLVPNADTAVLVRAKMIAAGIRVTEAISRASGAVTVETIAGFKGLEAVAVVALADRIAANNEELSYVCASRARALLIVIGPVAGTTLGAALQM